MAAVLALLIAAAPPTPGALVSAMTYCASGELTAGPLVRRQTGASPDLPELVRNFIATPPRFDAKSVTVVRFEGGRGAVAWAVSSGRGDCEFFLTGSPDPLAERDGALTALDPDFKPATFDRARPFWTHSFVMKAGLGKPALARLRGLGPGADPTGIQIDASFLPLAGTN